VGGEEGGGDCGVWGRDGDCLFGDFGGVEVIWCKGGW
jgi:hypothetical protein